MIVCLVRFIFIFLWLGHHQQFNSVKGQFLPTLNNKNSSSVQFNDKPPQPPLISGSEDDGQNDLDTAMINPTFDQIRKQLENIAKKMYGICQEHYATLPKKDDSKITTPALGDLNSISSLLEKFDTCFVELNTEIRMWTIHFSRNKESLFESILREELDLIFEDVCKKQWPKFTQCFLPIFSSIDSCNRKLYTKFLDLVTKIVGSLCVITKGKISGIITDADRQCFDFEAGNVLFQCLEKRFINYHYTLNGGGGEGEKEEKNNNSVKTNDDNLIEFFKSDLCTQIKIWYECTGGAFKACNDHSLLDLSYSSLLKIGDSIDCQVVPKSGEGSNMEIYEDQIYFILLVCYSLLFIRLLE